MRGGYKTFVKPACDTAVERIEPRGTAPAEERRSAVHGLPHPPADAIALPRASKGHPRPAYDVALLGARFERVGRGEVGDDRVEDEELHHAAEPRVDVVAGAEGDTRADVGVLLRHETDLQIRVRAHDSG